MLINFSNFSVFSPFYAVRPVAGLSFKIHFQSANGEEPHVQREPRQRVVNHQFRRSGRQAPGGARVGGPAYCRGAAAQFVPEHASQGEAQGHHHDAPTFAAAVRRLPELQAALLVTLEGYRGASAAAGKRAARASAGPPETETKPRQRGADGHA